jgi:hypothetical protein
VRDGQPRDSHSLESSLNRSKETGFKKNPPVLFSCA